MVQLLLLWVACEQGRPACGCRNSFARRLLEVSGSGSLVFVSNSSMMGDAKGIEAVALSDTSAAMHIAGLPAFHSCGSIAAVY